jgi:deoxyribose-phosphate aldolase
LPQGAPKATAKFSGRDRVPKPRVDSRENLTERGRVFRRAFSKIEVQKRPGCRLAADYGTASVCIKPYFVKRAAELLQGTGVIVGTVVGFPHGCSATESKRYETELACQDGAAEIDMVLNVGKALSGDWAYVERDVKAVCDEAHQRGAKVKVILETDYLDKGGAGLSSDDFKRRLCQTCERAGADWVKTSTGFGFVRQPDGAYRYRGATEHDLRLMRASVSPKVQVKAAGGVRDLDALIKTRDLGASRCGVSVTAAMLDEYRRRAAADEGGKPAPSKGAAPDSGGY